MRVVTVADEIYLFSTYFEPINFTFNQFLITGAQPLLVATGPVSVAAELLQKVKETLGGASLSYVFLSHFESDECGGLSLVLEQFPKAKPLCSQTTARQLSGFGICGSSLIQAAGSSLETADSQFSFLGYNSEMHLWEGLLLYEKRRSVLFSSDLFMQFGRPQSDVVHSTWQGQLDGLNEKTTLLPAEQLKMLVSALRPLPVALVAPGHGPCLSV